VRTEQQLRDAFTSVADQAPASEPVLERILAQTSPTTVRRRRAMLVLAAAFVVVMAVVLPRFLVDRSAVPADTRGPGNWNSIFGVDLPPDWEVVTRQVTATSESADLRTPSGTEVNARGCRIQVKAPGQPPPNVAPARRTAVDVNGRPGFHAASAVPGVELGALYWLYQDNAWALVECDDGRSQNLEIARRLVFEPSPLRIPYRLGSLPDGYLVRSVSDASIPDTTTPVTQVVLASRIPDPSRASVTIDVHPGTADVKPGLPGYETGTVNGMPAVFNADDRTLCLNHQSHQICLRASGDLRPDLTRSLWPQGYRELLVDLAGRLEVTKNLDSPEDWPDANQALPS
jgi:hypothetical protein